MLYFFLDCLRWTARNYLVTFAYFLPKNISRDVAVSPSPMRSASPLRPSLSSIVAPQNGLFPQAAHDSRLSINIHGGRKTTGWRASLGRGNCESPWRDRPQNGIVGSVVGRCQTWRS